MSTDAWFNLVFLLVAPFWALMIFLPKWSVTHRIIDSPWISVPPLVIFTVMALPMMGEVWDVVWSPNLERVTALFGKPTGSTMIWAQVLAWDLFLGRWMFLEARRLKIHPLVMGPLLFMTSTLPSFVLPAFLLIRRAASRKAVPVPA